MVITFKCNKVEVKFVDDNDVHNFKTQSYCSVIRREDVVLCLFGTGQFDHQF